jgi:membrane-bound metal-dependent hydrolase YbcI (DUF457 family)
LDHGWSLEFAKELILVSHQLYNCLRKLELDIKVEISELIINVLNSLLPHALIAGLALSLLVNQSLKLFSLMVLHQLLNDVERHYQFNPPLCACFPSLTGLAKELMNDLQVSENIQFLVFYDEIEKLA